MAAQNTYISQVTSAEVLFAPLCLTGDFNSQLWHILHEQMLSAEDAIVSRALDDVQTTLNQRWQGYEMIVCGSLATGLATLSSDIDLAVQIPNFNASASLHVLEETAKIFNKQPETYSRVKYMTNVYYISAYFSCFHIPSQRIVEIAFHSGDLAVSNTQLIQYYFKLDKRFLPVGVFLKYFFSTHGITSHGNGFLLNYALYLMIIFYLQQKNMAPSGYVLQLNSKSHFICIWDMGFNEVPYSTTNTESLHQLLGGFFKYYSEFNFEEYIVSPFTGRPILRTAFKDIENFPQEYNHMLKHPIKLKIQNNLNTSTDLCIQDVFMQDLNTAELMSHELATKFKYLMKSVATMFEDLSGESVLGAILATGQHEESVISCNNATVEDIH